MIMIINILGSIFIFSSCTILGIYYGNKSERKIYILSSLKKSFMLLSYEIEYMANPLYTAFENISKKTDGCIKEFYSFLAGELYNNKDLKESFKNIKNIKFIPNDILKEISNLGGYLSSIDKNIQLNSIYMLNSHIDIVLENLYKVSTKEKKLYRGMGMLFGIFIIVLLI